MVSGDDSGRGYGGDGMVVIVVELLELLLVIVEVEVKVVVGGRGGDSEDGRGGRSGGDSGIVTVMVKVVVGVEKVDVAKHHGHIYSEQGSWNTWLNSYPKKWKMKDGHPWCNLRATLV